MKLPDLTHLQFAILSILQEGERSGREVRDRLARDGVKKTGPAFYQLMARLEDGSFVKGWYTQRIIDGQIIKERRYKITGEGAKAWQSARDFYVAYFCSPALGGLVRA